MHQGEVLEKLSRVGLKLRLKKCHLFSKEMKYLGRMVSSEGVKTSPEKTEAESACPVKKNLGAMYLLQEICSGICGYNQAHSSVY